MAKQKNRGLPPSGKFEGSFDYLDRLLVLLSQKVAVSAPIESVFVEIPIRLGAEMNHRRSDASESRFTGYVEGLTSVIGHEDREEPLRHYCTGLLMPCESRSVEPIAAIPAPDRTA